MGKRKRRARQASIWVATQDLPRSAAHPFYQRLNREAHFDAFVEGACATFYAEVMGRPSLAPGRYFRLLLLGGQSWAYLTPAPTSTVPARRLMADTVLNRSNVTIAPRVLAMELKE